MVRNFTSSYESLAAGSLGDELREFHQQAQREHPTDLRAFTNSYLAGRSRAPSDVILIHLKTGARTSETLGIPSIQAVDAVEADPTVRQWLAAPPTRSVALATTIGGRPSELVGAPIVAGQQVVGTFIATTDLSAFVAERRRVLALSIAEAAVALLAGVTSTFFLLRRLLRTVGRITTTAEEIGSASLDQRLGDQGSDDEVGELARTFDAMLERVQTAMTAQRRLLSDVSHQLRTPLTVARGHLEVLERTGIDDPDQVRETVDLVIDELDHTRALVERLTMLGRAMEPDFLAPQPVELQPFLAELHEAVRVLAPRTFLLPPAPDLLLNVDAAKLRGAILNLIDNAVRATTTGDDNALVAAGDGRDGSLRLSVEDSGPGIPESQRAAVLRRFARPGARDADGSGLGLAIVKAVAEAHGGSIAVGESDLGGASVTVVLPATRILATRSA